MSGRYLVLSKARHDGLVMGLAIRGSLLVYVAGAALAFLTQVILARLLGAESYGIYYYALSWFLVISLVSQFGFDQTLLRFMPIYAQENDWQRARGIWKAGGRLAAGNGLMLGALMIIVVLMIGDALEESQRLTFVVAALCLPLRGLIYIRQAILRSFMFTVRSLLPDAIVAPLALITLALLFHFGFGWSSAPWFMVATLVAMLLAFSLGAYWQRVLVPDNVRHANPDYELRRWFRVAFLMLVINGAHILLGNIDVLILGFFSDPADVGIYGVAARISAVVTFALVATYPVFAPLIAKDHAAGRQEQLQRSITHGMRLVTVIAMILTLILIFWGPDILGFFGEEFVRGHDILLVLIIGQLVNALCGPVALLLAYGGQEPLVAKILSTVVVLSVGAQLFVIPRFGMLGAAYVTTTSVVIWNLLLYVMTRRKLGIDPSGWIPIRQ